MVTAIPQACLKVEVKFGGADFVDISDWVISINPPQVSSKTTQTHTFGETQPIVTRGKPELSEVSVTMLYSPDTGASTVYQDVVSAVTQYTCDAGTAAVIKWQSGINPEHMVTGIVTGYNMEAIEANSSEPVKFSFTIQGSLSVAGQ